MATITGLTAERMLEIEAASVVDGDVVGNDLFLTRKDGSQVNAGNVRGPIGPTGPSGEALEVVSGLIISDVGLGNQLRAGRQLSVADFTNMGLSAPAGLYSLSNVNDSSGNARHLTNKGAVPQVVGINGDPSTAASFVGNGAQVLYRVDSGSSDPFDIRTGSFGCWFRTAKRGTNQTLLSKRSGSTNVSYYFQTSVSNGLSVVFSGTGDFSAGNWNIVNGVTDVCDDRWHFAVGTFDGTKIRLYVDGILDGVALYNGFIFASSAPLNIGGYGGDATNNAVEPTNGRIDEAFVTPDVLAEEQVRNLYCVSIPHSLGTEPGNVNLSVYRRRRGAPLATTDFPVQPLRLYNFVNGALTDQGSNNVTLTNPGYGTIAGADGRQNDAIQILGGTGLASTDAGLPAGLTPRSFGCWFKTSRGDINNVLVAWGGVTQARLFVSPTGGGTIVSDSGADRISADFVADGMWHHVVVVEDNAPADGMKRKLYLDGRLVISSLTLNSIGLLGANRFRIGADTDATLPMSGTVDAVFVYGGILTSEQVRALYNVSSQQLGASLKDSTDHVETVEAARILAIFDTLESNTLIDLAVSS